MGRFYERRAQRHPQGQGVPSGSWQQRCARPGVPLVHLYAGFGLHPGRNQHQQAAESYGRRPFGGAHLPVAGQQRERRVHAEIRRQRRLQNLRYA